MSFWSSQKIIENKHIVNNFDENKVKEASYTLTIGNEAFITSNPESKLDEVRKLDITEGFCYIPPGQFAYLITDEEVNIPDDCLAFISMKFKTKADGLINVSGFHVDPGYRGKLIYAVYNAGVKNIPIRRGMEIFQIWFSNLDASDEKPRDSEKGYSTIPESILQNSQDAETLKNLSTKISELEIRSSQSSFRSSLFLGLLIPLNFFMLRELSQIYDINDLLTLPLWFWITVLIIFLVLLFHIEVYIFCRFLKNYIKEHHIFIRFRNIIRGLFKKIEDYATKDSD